ncbi:hypothetical protein [Pseudoxanthomonas gei]|uniref:hypothetical protein n=1 Tax=Pseudoxanthomonas gei TaxID=1383030 RepID=UPI001391ECE7|nr:hypothetical protein [Pseudoxanthomonas gei]
MHCVQRAARGGRVVGWVLCLALLAGCGGGPDGNEYVDYDGTTLVVEGTEYARENTMDPPGTFLPGRVVVQPEEGKLDDAVALIKRYGLTLEGRSAEGWLLAKAPDGFEMQWAAALQAKLGGRSFATNDSAQSPTPIVAAAAAGGDAPVAEESVPADEPSASDVRRIAIERYERIEQAGGLPMTLTATGQPLLLHAKVFDARKESCRRLPGAKPGEWECEAELMMGLCNGDCDPADEEPLPKGERVAIRWDPAQRGFALDD